MIWWRYSSSPIVCFALLSSSNSLILSVWCYIWQYVILLANASHLLVFINIKYRNVDEIEYFFDITCNQQNNAGSISHDSMATSLLFHHCDIAQHEKWLCLASDWRRLEQRRLLLECFIKKFRFHVITASLHDIFALLSISRHGISRRRLSWRPHFYGD